MYLKKLDEIFLKEINSHYNMSPTISAIKDILYKDIKNIDNFTVKNIPELVYISFILIIILIIIYFC